MSSWKANWNSSPRQECDDNHKAIGTPRMDLFGPIAYISIVGNKYDLVIVDDYSRFTWIFFLHNKSETQAIFKKFVRRAQNEFEMKIKRVRSDNRSEARWLWSGGTASMTEVASLAPAASSNPANWARSR